MMGKAMKSALAAHKICNIPKAFSVKEETEEEKAARIEKEKKMNDSMSSPIMNNEFKSKLVLDQYSSDL
jgi:hypothetical protein